MRGLLLALVLIAASLPAVARGEAAKDIPLDSKASSMQKAGVGPVIYPHAKHEKLFKCNECHPKVFKDKRGANNISMKANMEGGFCGSINCHNSPKAFPLYQCAKCHTNIKAGAAKKK